MKKVLSFVLVLSMILGSFGMAFAAAPSDVAGMSCEEAVNVLIELGVVEGYKDGSYKPERTVTRAEMATLIIKALGLNDYAVGKSDFTDMAGHWADPYVAYATSLGFIAGYSDGTFRPDETVTYDQAITMVVQALGYQGKYLTGGYPGAFVTQAKTLGLLDDIKSGAAGANRGDMAVLLYNALPVSLVRYDNEGSLQQVAVDKNAEIYDTMLRRLGAYADDEAFVVTGEESSLINLQEYVGACVTVYREDDAKGDILAINEVKSTFIKGEWEADGSVNTLTSGAVEFTAVDDTTYTIKADAIGSDFETFKNGVEGNITITTANGDNYVIAAETSGKKITDLYSITLWTPTKMEKVEEDDLDEIFDDHTLLGVDFEENDDEEIDLSKFALMGVDSLEDIKEDHIVYVYEGGTGDDAYIKRIAVGTEVVEGKISKVSSDKETITVNGTKYSSWEDDAVFTEEAGDEVRLFLDYAGDVFEVEMIEEDSDLMGIVIDVAGHEDGLNGETGKVKMFLSSGETKTFAIDDDDLDGDDFNELLTTTEAITAGSIVYYGVNENGELDALELADAAEKVTVFEADEKDITSKGYFDGHKIGANAVVFSAEAVTTGAVDITTKDWDDDLAVGSVDALKGMEDVAAVYYYDVDDAEIKWIVVGDAAASEGVFAVFNGYSSIDGDTDFEMDLMVAGEEETYGTDIAKNEMDAYRFVLYEVTFDAAGAVDKMEEVVDAHEDYNVTTASVSAVTKVKDSVVTTSEAGVATSFTLAEDVLVYTYDDEDEVWTKGSTSDIKDTDYSDVTFYDVVDTDKVYDIVLVK